MSQQILNQIRQVQSSLREQRRPIFQVEQAQKATDEANRFVKALLKKENDIAISKETQANIIMGLSEINRLFAQLSQNCRTENHFELYKEQFLGLIQKIHSLTQCIYFTVENGFLEFEPRALTLYQALESSWQMLTEFYQAVTLSMTHHYVPPVILRDDPLRRLIVDFFKKLQPLAQNLLAKKDWAAPSYKFSVEDFLQLNLYFRTFKQFRETFEHRLPLAMKEVLRKGADAEALRGESQRLEQKINRHRHSSMTPLLPDLVELEETDVIDLQGHVSAVYIQLEPPRLFGERQATLLGIQRETPPESLMEALGLFSQKLAQEQKQLQGFIEYLTNINLSIRGVYGVLANLAIAFGKIYQLTNKSGLTKDFLTKTFQSVHSLLVRSIQIAEARKTESQQLQQMLQRTGFLQKTVERSITNAFAELEQVKISLTQYDQQLIARFQQVLKAPNLTSGMIQTAIREAYEQREELDTAALYLGSVAYDFSTLLQEFALIQGIYEQITAQTVPGKSSEEWLAGTLKILSKYSLYHPMLLERIQRNLQNIDWFLEEVLLANLREEQRFSQRLKNLLQPVKQRAHLKQVQKLASEKKLEVPVPAPAAESPAPTTAAGRLAALAAKKGAGPAPAPAPASKKQQIKLERKYEASPYDPFSAEFMRPLKLICKAIDTERSLSILEVLDQPHVFYDYVARLEEEYDPSSPFGEQEYMDEVKESQTAQDFILAFIRMKLLAHGYFDANGQKTPYNRDTARFEPPPHTETFLKFTSRSMDTPKNIFRRLLRVMLGYDDPMILNRAEHEKIIELLKSDHILSPEEQERLKAEVPFVM